MGHLYGAIMAQFGIVCIIPAAASIINLETE